MRKIPQDNEYFHFHNENPKGRFIGDCGFRAIALALGISWEEAAKLNAEYYLKTGTNIFTNDENTMEEEMERKNNYWHLLIDHFGAREVYDAKENHDSRYIVGMRARDFIDEAAEMGKTYLVSIKAHVTVIRGRKIWDTWDCSRCIITNVLELPENIHGKDWAL